MVLSCARLTLLTHTLVPQLMHMESEKMGKGARILATMFERAVLRKAAVEVRIAGCSRSSPRRAAR